jgi:hypothetical protein
VTEEVHMAGSAKATTDHEEIRQWVEARGGGPARVKRTGRGDDPGLLRIDYPGFSGQKTLEKISWDEFFRWFDENELAFLHQDTTAGGKTSRFSKLVRRDSVEIGAPAGDDGSGGEAEPVEAEVEAEGDAVDLIEEQHDEVRQLFEDLEDGQLGVAPDLLNALGLHLSLEEALVYPMLLGGALDAIARESIIEHVGVKRLIADLVDAPVADDAWWAGVRVLRRQTEEHMDREEEEVLPVLRRELDQERSLALRQEMVAFMVETADAGLDAPIESALSNMEPRLEQ